MSRLLEQHERDAAAVEHFFCQCSSAEEGVPPPAVWDMCAEAEPEAAVRGELAQAQYWAAVGEGAVEDAPEDEERVEGDDARRRRAPLGMEALPLEYWHYDEDLWRPVLLEDRAGILPEALPAVRRSAHRRRGSLPGDDAPSEPAPPVVKAPALEPMWTEAGSGGLPPPFWESENCGPPTAAAAAVCDGTVELGPW